MQQHPEEGEGGSGVRPLDEGKEGVKGEAVASASQAQEVP